eukprot:361505-Chlamydomonas_euryale.AAC.13
MPSWWPQLCIRALHKRCLIIRGPIILRPRGPQLCRSCKAGTVMRRSHGLHDAWRTAASTRHPRPHPPPSPPPPPTPPTHTACARTRSLELYRVTNKLRHAACVLLKHTAELVVHCLHLTLKAAGARANTQEGVRIRVRASTFARTCARAWGWCVDVRTAEGSDEGVGASVSVDSGALTGEPQCGFATWCGPAV